MAGPSLRIDVGLGERNVERVRERLTRGIKRQLPFATAKSVTEVTLGARDTVRDRMGYTFRIKSRRVPKGVQARTASKADWPAPTGSVGVRDRFMADHAIGRVRKPKSTRTIAIPTRLVGHTNTGKVRAAQRPERLLKKPSAKIAEGTLRVPKPRARGQARRVSIMYLFRRRILIRKRWPFIRQVHDHVERNYEEVFLRNLRRAVASAR